MTSVVTSFDASITGDELDSTVQLLNVRLVAAWHAHSMRTIKSTRLALFIHGITSAKSEIWPAVLVGEHSSQLLIYLLDTGVRYSTYFLISSLRKAPLSFEAIGFNIHYAIVTS